MAVGTCHKLFLRSAPGTDSVFQLGDQLTALAAFAALSGANGAQSILHAGTPHFACLAKRQHFQFCTIRAHAIYQLIGRLSAPDAAFLRHICATPGLTLCAVPFKMVIRQFSAALADYHILTACFAQACFFMQLAAGEFFPAIGTRCSFFLRLALGTKAVLQF